VRAQATTIRGAACGIAAAALFGLSAPIAKLLLAQTSPLLLAGLFYLGSGGVLSLYQLFRRGASEAPLSRQDTPALAGLVVLGGILGPVLMLWGLSRVNALTGSLLLNLEAPFTMVVAVLLFKEHMGRHALMAAACIVSGAALLRLSTGSGESDVWGILAIAGACLAWALDNNLTQRLSLRDPFAVVRIKALAAGGTNFALALLAGHALPSWRFIAPALLVGSLSYGASIVLDAYALRLVGAAREAAFFATAPFIGAIASVVLLKEPLAGWDIGSMALMVAGVLLLLRERHGHQHQHRPVEHEHRHTHDQHHQHNHGPDALPGEPHTHVHRHASLVHDHPHVPDIHHRHEH
jgi:drug/metabolite transporter (DMT)-like permease